MESLVSLTPPYNNVWGTKGGNSAVGMLDHYLTVTSHTTLKDRWVQLQLQSILVIDSLPVPINVSFKALNMHSN